MSLTFSLPGNGNQLQASSVALRGVAAQVEILRADAAARPSTLLNNSWLVPSVAALAAGCAVTRSSRQNTRLCRFAAAAPVEEPAEPAFDPSQEPGATLPLRYWDPAGFCKSNDKDEFRTFRTAEIKHGRVAMLAAVGLVVQHNVKFPGFEAVPAGVSALLTPPGTFGAIALVAICGALELAVWTEDPSKEPGNFGDPVGFGQYNKEWRNRELNNGRMAMISTIAIIVTELITGKDGVEQILTPLSDLPVE
ncbi:Light-harvesting complex [Amphidinium carterae]